MVDVASGCSARTAGTSKSKLISAMKVVRAS